MCLQEDNTTVLAGQSYLSEVVRRGSSTRRTWADVNVSRIELILLPINFSGNHWTLFVSLKSNLSRRFLRIGLGLQYIKLYRAIH